MSVSVNFLIWYHDQPNTDVTGLENMQKVDEKYIIFPIFRALRMSYP
jgi:hypothetical protein